jgi:hypothetical protein
MLVPINTIKESLGVFHKEFDLYPLWVCPMRLLTPPMEKKQIVDMLVLKTLRLESTRVKKVDEIYKLMSRLADDLPEDLEQALSSQQVMQDYFTQEAIQVGPRLTSRWGFSDEQSVQDQKRDHMEVAGLMKGFLDRFPQTFSNGRQVARIWHGLESPQFPRDQWQSQCPDVWGKYRHWNFQELKRMADTSLPPY